MRYAHRLTPGLPYTQLLITALAQVEYKVRPSRHLQLKAVPIIPVVRQMLTLLSIVPCK